MQIAESARLLTGGTLQSLSPKARLETAPFFLLVKSYTAIIDDSSSRSAEIPAAAGRYA
jgi:hypothetical protein